MPLIHSGTVKFKICIFSILPRGNDVLLFLEPLNLNLPSISSVIKPLLEASCCSVLFSFVLFVSFLDKSTKEIYLVCGIYVVKDTSFF